MQESQNSSFIFSLTRMLVVSSKQMKTATTFRNKSDLLAVVIPVEGMTMIRVFNLIMFFNF